MRKKVDGNEEMAEKACRTKLKKENEKEKEKGRHTPQTSCSFVWILRFYRCVHAMTVLPKRLDSNTIVRHYQLACWQLFISMRLKGGRNRFAMKIEKK